MEHFDLVIVGAGWHGLAMAKTYLEAHDEARILVLDYARSVGGTWADERLYPGLKTNNIVGTYEFSDFPLVPKWYGIEPGQHIPGRVVYRYLCDFCDAFGLQSVVRLRTKVESATLLPDGDWQISYLTMQGESGEAGQPGTLMTSRLVLATGLTSEPFMPHFPGREAFKGPVFHAKDFKARAQELADAQTIVVIGGNKSAWDVCYSASTRFCAAAHMIIRRSGGGPSWCWPAKMGGYVSSISSISATRIFTWLDPNPYGSSGWPIRALINRTWLGRKLSEFFWRYLDDKLTKINAYEGSSAAAMLKPWSSTFWMGNSLSIQNYESSWFDLVKSGRITTHAAEVMSLSEKTVHLSDGTIIEADAVVCCTGWEARPNIRFFPEGLADQLSFPGDESGNQALEAQVRAKILGAAPVLGARPVRQLPGTLLPEHAKQTVADKVVKPSSPYRLYRFTLPFDAEIIQMKNFCVIGAHITLHTAIVAQAQALWITAFFDGKIRHLQQPDFDAIRRDTFHHTEYQRIRRPKETGGMGDRCPDLVFDSIPYVDVLLTDIGLRCHRKKSWYQEVMEPYRLCDFRGLVKEWLSNTRSGNTKPGTVVDRGVTEARNWDFFLQAHAVLQGTARPCHYYIVHDEILRQIYAKSIPLPFQSIVDIVEDLTHNMCYLFGRATKAVSLCPPAYYADLACERARCYLARLFDTSSPSAAPSVTGTSAAGGTGQPTADDVQIHQKLRDTMFYI